MQKLNQGSGDEVDSVMLKLLSNFGTETVPTGNPAATLWKCLSALRLLHLP